MPLPADYVGERHIAVLKSEPTKSPHVLWCEFQEMPGKGPARDEFGAMTVLYPR